MTLAPAWSAVAGIGIGAGGLTLAQPSCSAGATSSWPFTYTATSLSTRTATLPLPVPGGSVKVLLSSRSLLFVQPPVVVGAGRPVHDVSAPNGIVPPVVHVVVGRERAGVGLHRLVAPAGRPEVHDGVRRRRRGGQRHASECEADGNQGTAEQGDLLSPTPPCAAGTLAVQRPNANATGG